MTATDDLTPQLRAQVLTLEGDLRDRLSADPETEARWRAEHQGAVTAERSAASWVEFRDDRITQVAVAWVLTSVFLRFCEDNALVGPVWIAGPPARRQEALDAQLAYFRTNPDETDREWLMEGFQHLADLQATADLVSPTSPLRLLSPSGNAVTALLTFWRAKNSDGELVHDLRDPDLSTRFLGDLYQDLSDHAKKTYALLQTPVFVEEFILDQTLEPALAERPLDGFRLIDPTCGSGHFLLGAFDRLVTRWHEQDASLDDDTVVTRALDSLCGVDINPFAVAIARFRLTVAALHRTGPRSLENAPEWPIHVHTGDSLLFGREQQEIDMGLLDADNQASGYTYSTEDRAVLREVLRPGSYDVVVGNPPYITVKDKALNQRYRELYHTCKGTYALTVPFMERFFSLARPGRDGQPAGWTGQITSNSFMKREFGSKLIEDFLVRKDLRLVADTSGAYIPGHGTPTVIITGRNQRPAGDTVRAVLGVRGEPGRPDQPENGLVWRALADHVDSPGYEDEWVTITDLDRVVLGEHPWSLTGGGASELGATIESSKRHLADFIQPPIGGSIRAGADEAFMRPIAWTTKTDELASRLRPLVMGDMVRDWTSAPDTSIVFPYSYPDGDPDGDDLHRELWPWRTVLAARATFQGRMADAGLEWWEYMQFTKAPYRTRLSITFAFVATHNHFVLDRGGNVFNRSAPVIKLPEGASEDDHLALLGVLNSSTACFWLKQNSHNKGEGGGARVDAGFAARGEPFRETYEFTGTTLQDFPLPADLPLERGRSLDRLAQQAAAQSPSAIATEGVPAATALANAHAAYARLCGRLVAEQEELDWEVYRLYGLIENDLTYTGDDLPEVALGERAFEIVLARQAAAGQTQTSWFTHPQHSHTPVTEIPDRWPAAYQDLVRRRIDLITSDRSIGLLERPEHKRRWASVPWEKQQEQALRGWLLDRLEDRAYWFDNQGRPAPRSIAQLADLVARDEEVMGVLRLWDGRHDLSVTDALTRLLVDEAVPYLASYRLKDSGLRKRAAWEETWDLQRREDAGEDVGPIPVPPKYTSADFRKASWWQARGKLDVPKERFVLYPDAGRSTDPTALLGWAGWDHAEQALALNIIVSAREAEGWADEQLVPLVAGLAELQPWVEQWHSEIDQTYGMSMAAFAGQRLEELSTQVGRTVEELKTWRPEPARRGRQARG